MSIFVCAAYVCVRRFLTSLQDVGQFVLVVLVVLLAVLPRRKRLLVVLHERVPGVGEIQRLHHAQFAAGGRQRL